MEHFIILLILLLLTIPIGYKIRKDDIYGNCK